MVTRIMLTLMPEDSGKKNYHKPSSCPIACAFITAGYSIPIIGGSDYDVTTPEGIRIHGGIDPNLSDRALEWATTKQLKPITFEI